MTGPVPAEESGKACILVVDDDLGLGRTLRLTLQARAYDVHVVTDGRTALQHAAAQPPDLIVLDLGLPDVDGIHVLTSLRRTTQVPVVVLSARHEATQKVAALDLGADDYLTKPFNINELLARIRLALRHGTRTDELHTGPQRTDPRADTVLTPSFRLDLTRRTASRDGRPVHLTPTEWRIVEELTSRPGPVGHRDLLDAVWGPAYTEETNYLRVYLGQLRRKLETDPRRPRHFLTEAGIGYRFQP